MTTAYCTFVLHELYIGIDVTRVQEILGPQQLTVVPTADPVVAGLLNLRGRVVTALDLARRLELSDRTGDGPQTHVVLRTSRGELSLLVDAIGEFVDVADDSVQPLPRTLRGRVREFVTGAYDHDGRLLLLLDTERVVGLAPLETPPTTTPTSGRPSAAPPATTPTR